MQTRFLAFLSIFVMLASTLIILIFTQSVTPISPISPINPISQISARDTSNWLTYTNTRLGFSLQYPPNWHVTDANSDIYISPTLSDEEKRLQFDFLAPSIYLSYQNSLPSIPITATKVGDLDAFYTTAVPTGPSGSLVYIFPTIGRYLAVVFSPFDAKEPTVVQKDNIGIFTQILYSLRLSSSRPPVIQIGKPTPSSGCYYLQVQCVRAPCPPILTCPDQSPPVTNYSCPDTDWVDCMPGLGESKLRCQTDYLDWMRENCPNFQGVAY